MGWDENTGASAVGSENDVADGKYTAKVTEFSWFVTGGKEYWKLRWEITEGLCAGKVLENFQSVGQERPPGDVDGALLSGVGVDILVRQLIALLGKRPPFHTIYADGQVGPVEHALEGIRARVTKRTKPGRNGDFVSIYIDKVVSRPDASQQSEQQPPYAADEDIPF